MSKDEANASPKDAALRLALEYVELVPDDRYSAEHIDQDALITAIKAALEAKDEPVVWNGGVPAMLPKQKEGETFIVSYEPKLEAKDEPDQYAMDIECTKCGAKQSGVLTVHTTLPKQEAKDEPVANNWSVFNTGAEVWDKLSLADAVVELTPNRLERGWSAVCVINKDNPPVYTTSPHRKPLTEQQIKEALADMSALQMPLNKLIPAIARAIEAAHGIKGEA